MKKKFILLAMMLLTLIGGVKFNVLNAQETITIGSGTEEQAFIPIQANYDNTISEQIFLAEDFQGNTGSITSYAFKSSKDLVSYGTTITVTRNLKIYMINTDKASFVSKTDWVNMTNADMVFDGTVTVQPKDTWTTITFDTPFEYENGKNVLLCIVAEGDWVNDSGNYYKYPTTEVRSLVYYEDEDATPLDATNITVESKFDNLNYVAQSQFTFEASVPEVMPSSVPEITSIEATHNSVTLSWNAVENAKKYNVYTSTGDLVTTVSETSCTIENLDELTEYCYQVSAVNGELETEKSTESCATTLEAPKTRNIVFVLTDSYGDGWNGNTLQVYLNDVLTHTLSNENLDGSYQQEEEQTKILSIIEGTEVKVVYNYPGGNTYTNENSFEIYYEDGTLINGQDKITGNGTTSTFVVVTFTVELSVPKVTIEASEESIYLDETATLTATAANFEGDVTYRWSPVENLSDAAISNPVFTPTTTGIFEFTCTATDAQNNEASETITINVTERPALSLTVNANKTQIYAGHYATLQALVIGGFDPYTYSWSLGGQVVETADTYSFSASEPGEYTITCKVTDDKGEEVEKSETITVIPDPFVGKQFRIKVVNGTYANYYLNINTNKAPGTYDYSSWNYITESQVGVAVESDYDGQKFTIENDGDGHYYLKSADGYYIKCDYRNQTYNGNWWSVYAYSNSEKTPLVFEYVGENFYIRDYDKMTNNSVSGGNDTYTPNNSYFKVNSNSLVYCDAAISVPEVVLWTVEEILPKPENLVATPDQIYAGDVTTLTWNEFDGAASYNVYVNSELNGSTTGTSYELSGLAYNMNPGHKIEVVALNENGDVISGKASVIVQVAGTFTLTVNVTDGTNPIEGATVNIDMAYAYDEFKNQISPVTVEPTGADGKTTVELLRLPNEGFYNDNGNWVYPFYTVEVLKSPYQKQEKYINPGDVVTNGHTMDFVLALPTVSNIRVQDEEGENLDGDVIMEGTNVVLSWDAVEGADAYKVSKLVNGEVESSETVTETTYTIEGVLKGYQYAVSALFGELESVKTEANLQVKGNGYFKGYVTDGTNALQGIQVKVSSEYGDVSMATTNEEGYFIGVIMEGENYKLTISHSDYEEYILENITIIYNNELDLETIQLTAKPSASGITEVTATLNGENVDVNWTVDEAYTKYNVYRRLAGTQGKGDNIAQDVAVTSYTDAAWETLEPGTYQYGVSAFVEPQAQTRGTEVIFEEGFEGNFLPENWNQSGDTPWTKSQTRHSGLYSAYNKYNNLEKYSYLVTPMINTEGAKLSFWYMNKEDYGYTSDLIVYYSTESSGTWTNILFQSSGTTTTWLYSGEIDLSSYPENIYIAFCHKDNWGGGVYIDDVIITREKVDLVETQIVWSNDVVKQGPATFIGEDTENPTAWNVDANWSTGSVPAAGADVTINANAVISSEVNVSNLTINNGDSYPYNKLTVANGGALTVTGLIKQESNYQLVLEEGGQIFQNNANVTARFTMSIDNPSDWSNTSNKDGWQFISMPMENVSHEDFTSYGEYDLYKYDGGQDLEWQNHKDGGFDYGGVPETTFRLGVGYLASLKDAETATVYGTLNTATSKTWGQYYVYDKDLANFQLIGNPFTFDMDMTKLNSYETMVSGYAVVNANGEYEYKTDGTVKVGEGFFVKVATNYAQLIYDHNAKSTRSSSNNSLNITATGNAGKDNVVINLAGKSEGFDKLQNFNDAIATVYVAEDGKNYGIYNCDADVQEVELSFNANQMGNYTISIEPNGKFQTVTLVDRFTGVETNMLVEDYNFTAMSSDNHNRFVLRMVNGQQTTDNSHFVYQSGEELILNIQGEVQIVDVLGRVVYNGEAMNDINRINVSSFNSGAYMVKVMNGNEVKVEKVVIY